MLSGIGPKEHLQQMGIPVLLDLLVGENFQNHPIIYLLSNLTNPELNNYSPRLNIDQLAQVYFHGIGSLSQAPFITWYKNYDDFDKSTWPSLQFSQYVNGTLFQNRIMLMQPLSRGTVRLASADPFQMQLIDPNYLSHPRDMLAFRDLTKFILRLLTDSPLTQYISLTLPYAAGCSLCADRPVYECNPYIDCFVQYFTETLHHPSGTTRMGSAHRSDTVVDERLRVKGVDNLRVCDASVFPVIPNANTYAVTTMVAEKCADLVKQSINHQDHYFDNNLYKK